MGDLSHDCFNDLCRDCGWGGCTCLCHRDQEWYLLGGWKDTEEEADDD